MKVKYKLQGTFFMLLIILLRLLVYSLKLAFFLKNVETWALTWLNLTSIDLSLYSNPFTTIEPDKFTYSSLGKAFEKQITIEDQGDKQIKIYEEHGKQLIKSRGEKNSLTLLK